MYRYCSAVLISIVLCLSTSINAFAIEGFRGSSWGNSGGMSPLKANPTCGSMDGSSKVWTG